MILIYRVLTIIFYPFLIFLTFLRVFLNKEDSKRYREKIFTSHFNIKKNKNHKLIWFHAVSIGELKSITPIIQKLNNQEEERDFLITTSTFSSSKIADLELKNFKNVYHRFLPYDVNFLIKKFLHQWSPSYIFLVDSEIWPNLILGAKEQGIPISIINARITKKSFKRWMKFPKTASKIFGSFEICFASSKESEYFLNKLGVKKIYNHGNIKFFNNVDLNSITNLNKKILLERPFWIAASTHSGEEELCIKTHLLIREKFNYILTVIAPRHIERSRDIKDLCDKYKLNTQILNRDDLIMPNKEIVILNSFGVLNNYFKFAKSVFIGKSFLEKLKNVGGQNPLEAATFNCKVYHGPYVYNFEEIYKILEKHKISKEIKSHEDLSSYLKEDLDTKNKKSIKNSEILSNLGNKTLINTLRDIKNLILNENK